MDRTALRELKKGIDLTFKDFSRAYGDGIESFFDPLLYFLIWLEKLLVNKGGLNSVRMRPNLAVSDDEVEEMYKIIKNII